MPETNRYLEYEGYKNDKYIGEKLLKWSKCKKRGCTQFVLKTYFIVRNKEGVYGHIGTGRIWFLNYMTHSGAYCFNPLVLEEIVWNPFYQSYVLRKDQAFFDYLVIPGVFYRELTGVEGKLFEKTVVDLKEVPKLAN